MQTNQVMETIDRKLCGIKVKQRTKDSFMNLKDVTNIVYKARIDSGLSAKGFNFSNWLATDNVKEFLAELEKEIETKPYIKGTKSSDGWIHPFFAIKILTYFNPRFEIKVYQWLYDFLIDNRINSGDSYKRMCGVLFQYSKDKTHFANNIKTLQKL